MLNKLAGKMIDPSIKWYVQRSFGGYRRYGTISSTNPQTLHVCDDMVCLPVRFSEYISWWDKNTNTLTRMFNLQEAWDHVNETYPNTNPPYDGNGMGIVGYSGYFLGIDLTDGTNKVRVYLSVRYYPEPQVLVFNTGSPTNISVNVNDPPSVLGLSKIDTNGTRGTGTTTISGGQYVVFAKTTIPQVDSTNGVFAQSPIGSSKTFTYEMYHRILMNKDLGFNLYTGIKSPKDIVAHFSSFGIGLYFSKLYRAPINASGYYLVNPFFYVYDSDPYASAGTWMADNICLSAYTGWGEDESGNVKFILLSLLNRKHTTKLEQKGEFEIMVIYDADLDEWFATRKLKTLGGMYSYGQAAQVRAPTTNDAELISAGYEDASASYGIDSSNNVVSWTTPPPSTYTYYNGYWGFCNIYSKQGLAVAASAVGIYTDDTNISLPSDARLAFSLAAETTRVGREGIQIKALSDVSLPQGKTYLVISRIKVFPSTLTTDEFKSWATKLLPKVLSSSDVSGFMNILPLVVGKFGKPISDIAATIPGTIQPGSTITVSGQAPNAPNRTVYVAIVDPDTYAVIASSSGTTDASGNFSVNVNIPSTVQQKKYRAYVIVMP